MVKLPKEYPHGRFFLIMFQILNLNFYQKSILPHSYFFEHFNDKWRETIFTEYLSTAVSVFFFSKLDSIQTLKSTLSWFQTNDLIMEITRVMMSLSKMQEKHLRRSDTFDKVVGIWPATLHSLLLLHKFFPCIGANQLNLIRNNTMWKIFRALVSTGTLICMIIRYWFWFPLSFHLLKMKFTL